MKDVNFGDLEIRLLEVLILVQLLVTEFQMTIDVSSTLKMILYRMCR